MATRTLTNGQSNNQFIILNPKSGNLVTLEIVTTIRVVKERPGVVPKVAPPVLKTQPKVKFLTETERQAQVVLSDPSTLKGADVPFLL